MDNELLSMGQQFSAKAKGDDEPGTIKKGEPQVSKVVTEIKLPLLTMISINSRDLAELLPYELEAKGLLKKSETLSKES